MTDSYLEGIMARVDTPVDPGAIDLEAIRNYRGVDQGSCSRVGFSPQTRLIRRNTVFFAAAICDLIAAVEALRERVAELEARPAGIGREYDREPFTIEE